jgi:FkbM family methyltransferase
MQLRQARLDDDLVLNYSVADSLLGAEVAQTGTYESFESGLVLQHLPPGGVAVDVGANIGVYTLRMAKRAGRTGRVYAFEPEPDNFQILRKNVGDNGFTNVYTFDVALSDRRAPVSLYLSWDNYGDHRIYDAAYRRPRRTVEVMTDSLDRIVLDELDEHGPVSVIKIDTQGYEPFVLRGGERVIRRDRPPIFLEYWPFGYQRAGADSGWMMRFLGGLYRGSYFIDERGQRLIPADQGFLDAYFAAPGRTEEYCNLAFLPE